MGYYYVLTQVTNISQRNPSEPFQQVLGETAQKWQLVDENFLLITAFYRARMAFTSSLARSVMSPQVALITLAAYCPKFYRRKQKMELFFAANNKLQPHTLFQAVSRHVLHNLFLVGGGAVFNFSPKIGLKST